MKNYSRLIDDYLMGNLSPEELKEFEKELKKNPSLEKEVMLCRELKESIVNEDVYSLREMLNRSHLEAARPRKTSIYKLLLISTAAALLLLMGIKFLFEVNKPNYEKIYQIHFQPYQITGNTRDVNNTTTILSTELIRLYFNKEYEAVVPILEAYLDSFPKDYQANLMLATALLETQNAHKAEIILRELMEERNELAEEIVQWHFALSLLRQGKIEELKQVLEIIINDGGFYSENAKSILRTLNK